MNRAVKTIVSVFGIILGLSVINHGLFEALQGNIQTPGLIVQAIGPATRFWVHGTEEAFTIVPNFLITGILAMMVGIAIIVWSIWFVYKKFGSTGFILLFVLSFLVGGGIGQIAFFVPLWIFSMQISKSISKQRKILHEHTTGLLSRVWPYTLSLASVLFIFALEIAIFGVVPGLADVDKRLYFCWSLLGVGFLTLLLTFFSGLASDVESKL